MRILRVASAGLLASTWLLVATFVPVRAEDFGPGQPDPCVFISEFVWGSGPLDVDSIPGGGGFGYTFCQSGFSYATTSQGLQMVGSVSVGRQGGASDADAAAVMVSNAQSYGLTTASYGHEGYEGPFRTGDGTTGYMVIIRVHNYVGTVKGHESHVPDIQAAAGRLSAAMLGRIGPIAPVLPTAAPTATLTASVAPAATPTAPPLASGSPAIVGLSIGIGCGADERYVRCTASVYGARPDADLVFTWRFDGIARPETGSTMQMNWLLEGVNEGYHTVGVDVRDARNNIGPVSTSTGFVLGQVPVAPADDGGDALAGAIAAAATAGVTIGVAIAAGAGAPAPKPALAPGSDPTAVAPTTEADALDTALELEGSFAGGYPPFTDYAAWKRLTGWPGERDADFAYSLGDCHSMNSAPAFVLACMRARARHVWATITPPLGNTAAWLNFANWPPEAPDWFPDSWKGCMQKSAGEVNQTFVDCLRAAADEARDYLNRNRDSIAPLPPPTTPGPAPTPSPAPDPDKAGLDKIMDDLSK